MPDLSLPKRLYYIYLGHLYRFTHLTSNRHILGISLATIVKLLAIALVLAAWLYDWGRIALAISILLLVWVFLAYWRAGRSGYFRFIAGPPAVPDNQDYETLAPYKRVSCIASGIFSVQNWEKNVLLRPANYWQVPRGDHALMVEHEPQRFLYQFFDVATMQELQRGWLLYGSHPQPALSVTYLSIWGPEFTQEQYSIFGSDTKPVEPKPRTIYLSFPSEEIEKIICSNILRDVQRHQGLLQAE